MNAKEDSQWVLVASGELGDLIFWEPGFTTIERAQNLLCLLEEVGAEKIEWSYLLDGLPRLKAIEHMNFPPLYSVDAFDEIDGFYTEQEEPMVEYPGTSFMQIKVEVQKKEVDELLEQFRVLVDRLENYPLLEGYIY